MQPVGQGPQVLEPGVFVHVATREQPPLFCKHSFMSLHLTPSPE